MKKTISKEYKSQYVAEWRRKNPEKAKEHAKKSRERNKDKIRERQKAWTEKNKDKHSAKSKAWYAENKDKVRDSLLRREFGISLIQYDEMFKAQNGKCAICEKEETARTKRLAVDHCHKTGKIRKLLCRACNVGIGNLQDSPELLLKAIEYLKHHS